MSNITTIYKAIKSAYNDSKGPPVLVFIAGGLKSGKTTTANQIKNMCIKNDMRAVIVEQSQTCNKTYDDLKYNLEQVWRVMKSPAETKLDGEISVATIEINKLSKKLEDNNADTEKYEELSQTQIDLNTRLVALKNSRAELTNTSSTNIKYVFDVVILDRTQIYTAHRNTIIEIYTSLFKSIYPKDKCIGVNMVTSLETCISRLPKNRYYESAVKFMTSLHEGFEGDRIMVDQGYAYVFDIDGFTPNTTELQTVPNKQQMRRNQSSNGGGGSANVWTARKPEVVAEVAAEVAAGVAAEVADEVADETPFDPVDLAPDTMTSTESIKMEGFVLALDNIQRTGLIATLKNLKGQGILGNEALKHPVMYCNAISCRRTTKELTDKSFKNVPMPGTKVKVTFYAYVCDSKLGCLTGRINDMKNFVSGRTFLPIDLTLGNNGNASKMLETKKGIRYAIDPITIEMTVGIVIRNPDFTTKTVYDVHDIAVNMFEVLSGTS